MRARGHVDEVALFVRFEGIGPGEIEERPVHFLEVPGVPEFEVVGSNLGLRRDRQDVGGDFVGEPPGPDLAQQFEARDHQVLVTAQIHRGSPWIPAVLATAVESRSKESDHHRSHARYYPLAH